MVAHNNENIVRRNLKISLKLSYLNYIKEQSEKNKTETKVLQFMTKKIWGVRVKSLAVKKRFKFSSRLF